MQCTEQQQYFVTGVRLRKERKFLRPDLLPKEPRLLRSSWDSTCSLHFRWLLSELEKRLPQLCVLDLSNVEV